ncbi:hypothetical protein [Geodermatophilus sp. URMC 63]
MLPDEDEDEDRWVRRPWLRVCVEEVARPLTAVLLGTGRWSGSWGPVRRDPEPVAVGWAAVAVLTVVAVADVVTDERRLQEARRWLTDPPSGS